MLGHLKALLGLVALAGGVPAAAQGATDFKDVWIRAVATIPPPAIVDRVAKDAEPHRFSALTRSNLESETFERVAQARCGSLQPGYAAAFDELNEVLAIKFKASEVVGAQLYQAEWPACLWARRTEYRVKKGEHFFQILEQVSGQGKVSGIWRDILRDSGLRSDTPEPEIDVGNVLKLVATEATKLRIRADRLDAFFEFIRDHVRDDVRPADRSAPPVMVTVGKIFTPVGMTAQAGAAPSCTAGRPPFDAGAVAAAYKFASAKRRLSGVEVVIVDNGFFGLHCGPDGCPRLGNPFNDIFPANFFDRNHDRFDEHHKIGPPTTPDLPPSNYALEELPERMRFDPQSFGQEPEDDIPTHGTHVAGLAIGGPPVFDLPGGRALLYPTDNRDWARLLVLSVSPGSQTISSNAITSIWPYIRRIPTASVANMSFVLTIPDGDQLRETISSEMRELANVLFVVAAGNGGDDEVGDVIEDENLMPADLGGTGSQNNVITVAAVDGDNRLALFSNYGDSADLAAPGCQIASWVGGTTAQRRLSGTSQAAPIVTFAASLLRSIWDTTPLDIKQRLVYAGDYLPCTILEDDVERCVSGKSRLNIPKALLVRRDVLTFRDEASGLTRQVFGKLITPIPPRPANCTGKPLRSLKRTGADGFLAYTGASGAKLTVCSGTIGTANQANEISFEIHGDLVEGSPTLEHDGDLVEAPPSAQLIKQPIKLSQIDDLVLASAAN